ncbi:MAG: delta-60 repeat domain-containing protein [Microthrixaceae bacterium]
MAMLSIALVTLNASDDSKASADAPAIGDPDVLPAVNFDELDPDPVTQWGVVGIGNTYSAPKSEVWAFAEIGDRIYVGGAFTGVQRNGDDPSSTVQPQAYLAAFDRDSGTWIDTFRPQLDRAVYALEPSPDGKLLVGGEFTQVNGAGRTGLVELDPATGATIGSFQASIEANNKPMVRDIVRVGNDIYIAGQISRVRTDRGADWRWNAARLNGITGALDLTWVPKFMGGIWQLGIDPSRSRVSAAGFFTSVDGQPGTARFASVTQATGAYIPGLTAFQTNTNGQMDTTSVIYADNKWWVGGAQHVIQALDANTNTRLGYITAGIACNTFSPNCGYSGGGDIQVMQILAGGQLVAGCHCYGPGTIYSSFTNSRTADRFAFPVNTANGAVSSSWVPGLKQRAYGTYGLFADTRGCYYVGGDYNRQADGQWLGGFGRFCKPVAQPTGLTGSASGTSVTINWSPPASQLPVDYYKVYRDGVFLGDTTGLSYSSQATAGTSPVYTVRTRDVSGRLSTAASVTVNVPVPVVDTQAPTVPTNVTGSASGSSVTLNWGASTDLPDPGGVGLSGYLIHRDYNFIKFVAAGTTTYTDSAVAAGSHRYEVRAVDRNNNMSAPAVRNVTVGTADTQAPTVPTNVTGSASGSSVTLNWGASTDLPDPGGVGLSGYLIHRDYNYIQFVPAGTTTYTNVAVPAGNHRFEVRAVDRNNNMSAPAVRNVTVGTPDTQAPTVPTNVTGSASGSSVTLNWGASTDLPDPGGVGLSGYLIHRDWVFIKFIPAGTTSFVDTGVASGNRKYQVRSVDKNNNISDAAPIVTVSVP